MVPELWNDSNGRNLNLNYFDNRWNDNYRFAAVRKSLYSSAILWRKFPVVALGSVWQDPSGDRVVPGLWGASDGRDLYLTFFDRRWYDSYRFAAVRK